GAEAVREDGVPGALLAGRDGVVAPGVVPVAVGPGVRDPVGRGRAEPDGGGGAAEAVRRGGVVGAGGRAVSGAPGVRRRVRDSPGVGAAGRGRLGGGPGGGGPAGGGAAERGG